MRKLSAQMRLFQIKKISAATATPKVSECVKPAPG